MQPNAPTLRATRVVLLALAGGVTAFATVVVFMRLSGMELGDPDSVGVLPFVVAAVAMSSIAAYVVLRQVLTSKARESKGEGLELLKQGRIPGPLNTLAIVGAALAEGVGLLATVTLLLGGPWLLLGVPVVSIGLILIQLPTADKARAVLEA